jgi:hypothetical protein
MKCWNGWMKDVYHSTLAASYTNFITWAPSNCDEKNELILWKLFRSIQMKNIG